ncbi:MAG: hypothetical protein FJ290_12190 [Planctomycetes bacterium]|nr:hypothetical protein [Planctomycetota bacterium]
MSDSLKCAYCREPLPERAGRQWGLRRCPTCKRRVLATGRIAGSPLRDILFFSSLLVLWPIYMIVPATTKLWHLPFCLCAIVAGVVLAHDGYLCTVTRIACFQRVVFRGRKAALFGCLLIAFGLLFAAAAVLFSIWNP